MPYVDDAFMLLPKSVGSLVASAAIMLVSALGPCVLELGQVGHWQRFDLDWLALRLILKQVLFCRVFAGGLR